MGAQKLTLRKRLVAGLGTIAMASLAVFGAGTAHAAPEGQGNIDFGRQGSITVHKHEQPEIAGAAASGAPQDVNSPALSGVEFSIERVDIDLTDPQQWEQLDGLSPDALDAEDLEDLEHIENPVETVNGVVKFDKLPVGVYLITEGDDNGNNNIVRKAEPFIVVIPMAIERTWTYDLHVYPKNSVTALTKELDAVADGTAYAPGDTIAWNVASKAPQLAQGDELNRFSFVDEIDSRLDFTGVSEMTYKGQPITDAAYAVQEADNVVTITLTEPGRDLIKANGGGELTFTINTTVAEGADIGTGVIANDIQQFTTVNEQEHVVETPEATTYWGSIRILKKDKANNKPLSDAKFQIYRNEVDAKDGKNPIKINGAEKFTTDKNGLVEIGPLNAGADNGRTYYLVETAPPAGYQADDTIHSVEITAGVADRNIVIDNIKQPAFDLPLTGAAGTGIFMLVGLALLTLGGGLYTRNRRKAQA